MLKRRARSKDEKLHVGASEQKEKKVRNEQASASPRLQSNSHSGSTVANAAISQTGSGVVAVKRASQRLAPTATDTQQLKEISSWSGSVIGCFSESIFPACLEQLKGNGGIPKSIRNLFVFLVYTKGLPWSLHKDDIVIQEHSNLARVLLLAHLLSAAVA